LAHAFANGVAHLFPNGLLFQESFLDAIWLPNEDPLFAPHVFPIPFTNAGPNAAVVLEVSGCSELGWQ
jgi:hypothetical protein